MTEIKVNILKLLWYIFPSSQAEPMYIKLLSIFFLLTVLLSLSCDQSKEPHPRRQKIDTIMNQFDYLNAQVEAHRSKALEYDADLKGYRQEIQQLRSEMETGRKARKAKIQKLKDFANQAKKARKAQRLRVLAYTRKVEELVAGFDAFSEALRRNVSLSDFKETFGEPDIVEENLCYYMGAWTPGATLLKVRFSGDTILDVSSERYDESALVVYIPKLIDSLKSENANIALGAFSFLYSVMTMTYPHGYYEQYYLTDDLYKGTPFETYTPDWNTNVYQQWKDWWELDGRSGFQRMARERSE